MLAREEGDKPVQLGRGHEHGSDRQPRVVEAVVLALKPDLAKEGVPLSMGCRWC